MMLMRTVAGIRYIGEERKICGYYYLTCIGESVKCRFYYWKCNFASELWSNKVKRLVFPGKNR